MFTSVGWGGGGGGSSREGATGKRGGGGGGGACLFVRDSVVVLGGRTIVGHSLSVLILILDVGTSVLSLILVSVEFSFPNVRVVSTSPLIFIATE